MKTIPSSPLKPRRKVSTLRLAIFLFAGTVAALACAESYYTDHSVRFNSDRIGRAFYRLPPLPIAVDPKTGKELSTRQIEQYDYVDNFSEMVDGVPVDEEPGLDKRSEAIWQQAEAAIENSDLDEAAPLLKKYLDMTSVPTSDNGVEDFYEYRNSAYDMLDAITALKKGSSKEAIEAYIKARNGQINTPSTDIDALIKNAPIDANLRDNWAYLQAATLSRSDESAALDAFKKHAAEFPTSEKHEAVLFMIARLTMKQSYSTNAKGCYIEKSEEEKEGYGNDKKAETEPKETCQDEAWHEALKDFQAFIEKYPHGRYTNDARGWIAKLYLNGEEPSLALAEYYRILGNRTDLAARLAAKKSLQAIGHRWKDETLDKTEELIANDSNAALAYAYHRIYNVAIDCSYTTSHDYGWTCWSPTFDNRSGYRNDDDDRVTKQHALGKHELERVTDFSTRMIERYPQANVSGGFILRVAEAQLELENYAKAGQMARKALSMNVSGDLRAQALWIKGSSEHQTKALAAARITFDQLIREFPDDKLTEGARRLLAMTAEDQNDFETALEQYMILKYDDDVAYLVDVLMPADRLAKFVNSHPKIELHNEFLYALGLRYMRDSRWDEARAVLHKVETTGTIENSYYGWDNEYHKAFAKDPDYDGSNTRRVIKTSWVIQDLKTIDTLEHLQERVDTSQSDETKAEALYQLASYQYDADDLLFYNPNLWQGGRIWRLQQAYTSGALRLPNEARTLFEYSESHDTLARALPIYIEIMEKYPQTKAAPDAMFTAAVAHERLSGRQYWRDIYDAGMFAGPRMVELSDIHKVYPKFRWPISRLQWQASTRTVNGGPAWPALPKPAPKLTQSQLIERRYDRGLALMARLWAKTDPIIKPYLPDIGARIAAGKALFETLSEWLFTVVTLLIVGYTTLLAFHFLKTRPTLTREQMFSQLSGELPMDEREEQLALIATTIDV